MRRSRDRARRSGRIARALLSSQYATMLEVVDRRAGQYGRSTSRLVAAAGTGGEIFHLNG